MTTPEADSKEILGVICRARWGKGYDARKLSFQLSDHFPIWIQVRTNIDGWRMEQVVQNGRE